MKTCKMCKWAARADDPEARVCRKGGGCTPIGADDPVCESYVVSAWTLLESIAYAERRLEDMSWRARHYRDLAGRATGSTEAARISGTGEASRVASNCDRCIDIAIDIDRQAERLRERLALVCRMIEDIQNPEERRVLELRHREYAVGGEMRRLSWEEIARKMHYDQSSVRRIHSRALRQIQRQMDAMGVKE